MRIGIDARCFVTRQSGIGRYAYQLCKELADRDYELFCYLPLPHHPSFSKIEGVTYRESLFHGSIRKLFWESKILPTLIFKDNIDVFWGPAHRLPLAIKGKIPCVLTIHDLVWIKAAATMRFKSWLVEKLCMGKSIKAADVVISVSKSTALDIAETFGDQYGTFDIVPPGVSEFLSSENRPSLINMGISFPYVLCVGTIEPRKNHIRLLEAYAKLPTRLKDQAHLIIVGGAGWGNINIEQKLNAYGLTNHVKYLSGVDDGELATLYDNCLFLTMVSIYEGFGMPLIEAMAFGKAVLTSNISSMPEVTDGAGLLVDPYSVDSIADGLRSLLEQSQLRSELAANAKMVASQYSWYHSADTLIKAFSLAIERKQGC